MRLGGKGGKKKGKFSTLLYEKILIAAGKAKYWLRIL